VPLLFNAVDHYRLAEVDLGVAGRMDQRQEHLTVPDLAHDIHHRRMASGVVLFVTQASEDPPRPMPLLAMLRLVGVQDGPPVRHPVMVDGAGERMTPVVHGAAVASGLV
jgi:hypothetical protein